MCKDNFQQLGPCEGGIPVEKVWSMLYRHRTLIILIFVACLLGGLAFSWGLPREYEARGQLNLGQVAGSGYFEHPEVLAAQLNANASQMAMQKPLPGAARLVLAQQRRNAPGTIDLIARARSPEEAQLFLEDLCSSILEHHRRLFDNRVATLATSMKMLDDSYQALQRAYQELNEDIDAGSNARQTDLVLLAVRRGEIGQALLSLSSQRRDWSADLLEPRTYPTTLRIYKTPKPVSPKTHLIFASAAILGLIFGVLGAYARDLCAARSQSSIRKQPPDNE